MTFLGAAVIMFLLFASSRARIEGMADIDYATPSRASNSSSKPSSTGSISSCALNPTVPRTATRGGLDNSSGDNSKG
jgi:hypothetical protein